MRRIKNVMVFPNGAVAVFDYEGRQIARLQGRWDEKRDRICYHADQDTDFAGSPAPIYAPPGGRGVDWEEVDD